MRLAAQAKLGFYPAHPTAIGALLKHLHLGDENPEKTHIIDPCCGKGDALMRLATGLGVDYSRTYGVELDSERVEQARLIMPGAHIVGPASFMGMRITSGTFGLAYVNPPFDDELGGGRRQEYTFAREATRLLKAGGILALVMPVGAISGRNEFQRYLDAMYEDAAIFQFPDEVRKFNEIVFIGRRRKAEATSTWDGYVQDQFGYSNRYGKAGFPVLGTRDQKWSVPWTWTPASFDKVQMTEDELIEAISTSPLNRHFDPPKVAAMRRPPLPLYKGHVALLLASGMLDGVVHPEGQEPHVVRGTARKETFLADKSTTENPETGAVTDKEVWSQKIVLTVRAVGPDGVIRTFADEKKPDEGPGEQVGPETVEPDDGGGEDVMSVPFDVVPSTPENDRIRKKWLGS